MKSFIPYNGEGLAPIPSAADSAIAKIAANAADISTDTIRVPRVEAALKYGLSTHELRWLCEVLTTLET
jgi:hypothetical protein